MKGGNGSMDLQKTLKVVYILFFGGLGLLVLAWIILSLSKVTVSIPAIISCVLGIVATVAGIVLAHARLRCPYCGASLMLGGRIPSRLPNFCPECGNYLE